MKEKSALFVQFAISTTIGCFVFWVLIQVPGQNPKVPMLGALVSGFFGGWAVMFLYVLGRHGWQSAKSLEWDGA